MTTHHYKAVRQDMTSWHDATTRWAVGGVVQVTDCDDAATGVCGRGLHSSRRLLDAVQYQRGPSAYLRVEVMDPICSDDSKTRSRGLRVLAVLTEREVDELAGFRLWEANHPVNPLALDRDTSLAYATLLTEWASVKASAEVSIRASVEASVRASVEASVAASIAVSVAASVWASAEASIWAYTGGLFPAITQWQGVPGPDPWRPLLTLWYGGYVPNYDGRVWRLHAGPQSEIVYTQE